MILTYRQGSFLLQKLCIFNSGLLNAKRNCVGIFIRQTFLLLVYGYKQNFSQKCCNHRKTLVRFVSNKMEQGFRNQKQPASKTPNKNLVSKSKCEFSKNYQQHRSDRSGNNVLPCFCYVKIVIVTGKFGWICDSDF